MSDPDERGAHRLDQGSGPQKLRGAYTVVVGIQPEVAFAMVQLGLSLDGIATALDLEEGLALRRGRDGQRALRR